MHLTNEQLLELNKESREHLIQCDNCSIRAKNLSAMRGKLQNLAEQKPMSDNWQHIKASYQHQNYDQQMNLVNKKTTFWRNMTVAMAASLVLFMAGQNYFLNSHHQQNFEQTAELTRLIESNNIIQSLLVAQFEGNSVDAMKVVNLQIELDIIDKTLQQAYLKNISDKEKTVLWQQRQALIQSSFTADKQPKIMKI
ncbi:MAG: hypothetical protein JKY81_13365 [Colwellia sp.]|nr:hypothetical protein [Colwellia sp.]